MREKITYRNVIRTSTKLVREIIKNLSNLLKHANEYKRIYTLTIYNKNVPPITLKVYLTDEAKDNFRFKGVFTGYATEGRNEIGLICHATRGHRKIYFTDCIPHEIFHYCEYHMLGVRNTDEYFTIQNKHCIVGNFYSWNDNKIFKKANIINQEQYVSYFITPRELYANMFATYITNISKDKLKRCLYSKIRDVIEHKWYYTRELTDTLIKILNITTDKGTYKNQKSLASAFNEINKYYLEVNDCILAKSRKYVA